MNISENLQNLQNQIEKAAGVAGRNSSDIHLVAVSKKQPVGRVHDALAAGQRRFGENRVQEAKARWTALRPDYPALKLHLIGPLQTNKVKEAVALFDVIETLDREKLARALAKEMQKQARFLPCFIQVNLGGEEQKAGISIDKLKEFYSFCTQGCALDIRGLMCIPPINEPPALHFALLKKHADQLGLCELSMGMSADFEKAIALGATHIRVGTGVFGPREE